MGEVLTSVVMAKNQLSSLAIHSRCQQLLFGTGTELTAGKGVDYSEVVSHRWLAGIDQVPVVDVHRMVGGDCLRAEPPTARRAQQACRWLWKCRAGSFEHGDGCLDPTSTQAAYVANACDTVEMGAGRMAAGWSNGDQT